MGYLGAQQIKYLRNKPQFVKITKAGFYESMVHNVDVIKNEINTNKKIFRFTLYLYLFCNISTFLLEMKIFLIGV